MPPVWSSDFPPRFLGTITWPARSRRFRAARPSGLSRGCDSSLEVPHPLLDVDLAGRLAAPARRRPRRAEAREEVVRASRPCAPASRHAARQAAVGRHDDHSARGRARARPRGRSRRPRCRPTATRTRQAPERRRAAPRPGRRRRASPAPASAAAAPRSRRRAPRGPPRDGRERSGARGRSGCCRRGGRARRRAGCRLAPGLRERAPRMLEAEEQHRAAPAARGAGRARGARAGRREERGEPGHEEHEGAERERDDVLGERERELREAAGRGRGRQARSWTWRSASRASPPRRGRDRRCAPPGDGSGTRGQHSSAPTTGRSSVWARFQKWSTKRDLVGDELGQEQHERGRDDDVAREKCGRRARETPAGRSEEEAVEEQQDRPGVQARRPPTRPRPVRIAVNRGAGRGARESPVCGGAGRRPRRGRRSRRRPRPARATATARRPRRRGSRVEQLLVLRRGIERDRAPREGLGLVRRACARAARAPPRRSRRPARLSRRAASFRFASPWSIQFGFFSSTCEST